MSSIFWQDGHTPLTRGLVHCTSSLYGIRLVTLKVARNEKTHEEA